MKLAPLGGSVGGLLLGLAFGTISHQTHNDLFVLASPWIKGAGTLWLNALSALVIPLTLTNVVTAILGGKDARLTGAVSARAFSLFVGWLLLGATFTLLIGPPVLALIPVDSATVAAMVSNVPQDALKAAQQIPAATTPSEIVARLVPRNLLEAAVNEDLLPLLAFAMAFAFAASRTSEASRQRLTSAATSISEALMVLVRWLLVLLPVGAFALAYIFTESAGVGIAGVLGQFTVLSCAAMLAFTLLLYPITALVGRVSIVRFARAVLPAQIAAATTRSSIASLPAMLDGATRVLQMNAAVANLVLPLSVAVFKVNRTVSATIKVLFIAHIFGVPIGVPQMITFVVTIMILSFTALGIPGGGTAFKSMAAYMAVGIPIEGYILLEAVDAIADIFKTILNVTGDMSVAVVTERFAERPIEVAVAT